MFYTVIKNIFIFVLSFYVYTQLINYKYTLKAYVQITLSTITLTVLATRIAEELSTIYFPFVLPFYFLTLFLLSQKQQNFSLIYAIVSICVPYIVFPTLAWPATFIFYIVGDKTKPLELYISYITTIVGIASTILIVLSLRNSRVKKALHLFCNYNNFVSYSFLSFALTLTIIVGQAKIQDTVSNKKYTVVIFIVSLTLLTVIQRQTQKYYLSKLKKLELESLRQELAEKNALIQKLQKSNEDMARIIHKDNKLIPSMEAAVQRFLLNIDCLDPAALHENGAALAKELQLLSHDRRRILTACSHLKDGIPHTGYAALDAILSHMRGRALALQIECSVTLSAEFADTAVRIIPEADLTHLLADLIENAIIAAKGCEQRLILVHLGMLYEIPVIEISDSGRPFDPAVYQDFGLQKHSTHLNEGGSGIGLMDIWELKKTYSASLHIHEYAKDSAPFTKKLSIVFDNRNHYLIRTYRPQELLVHRTRTDMYILPLE